AMVKFLVSKGADVRGDKDDISLGILMEAIKLAHYPLMQYLLTLDVVVTDAVLYGAKITGRYEMYDWLVRKKSKQDSLSHIPVSTSTEKDSGLIDESKAPDASEFSISSSVDSSIISTLTKFGFYPQPTEKTKDELATSSKPAERPKDGSVENESILFGD